MWGGWIVAYDITTGDEVGDARLVVGADTDWKVTIDSVSLDDHGEVRMLVPIDDRPRVFTFEP